MFPSLEQKLDRYEQLERQLEDPDVLTNVDRMLDVQKEMGGLAKVAEAVREFRSLEEEIEAAQMMVDEESPLNRQGAAFPSPAGPLQGQTTRRAQLLPFAQGEPAAGGFPKPPVVEIELRRRFEDGLGTVRRPGAVAAGRIERDRDDEDARRRGVARVAEEIWLMHREPPATLRSLNKQAYCPP